MNSQENMEREGWDHVQDEEFLDGDEADLAWEEEQAELDYFQRRFGLSQRTYRNPRMPKNEKQRFEMHRAEIQALSEFAGLENVWEITYTPARFEGIFLRTSLQPFYEQDQIVDVMAQVKGGKEANVYRCRAHSSMGTEWVAAKVYRPRQFRNLSNDAMYREGRNLLTEEDGRAKAVRPRDDRTGRAVNKKTAFGVQVRHTSWLMYEFSTLQSLYAAGVPVPKPFSAGENAILMEYIGDENMAAPTLHEVRLEDEEAEPLFAVTLQGIATMLQKGFVHGDLSAFNILYWQGDIKLIDFPQVIDIGSNRNAHAVLRRDVTRICQYFGRYGITANPNRLTNELWDKYADTDPDDVAADLSRLSVDESELEDDFEEE